MVLGFPEGSRLGQRARDGNCEDEDEPEAAPAPLLRVRDQREYPQQARDLPGFLYQCWSRRYRACETDMTANTCRLDLNSAPVINPGGRHALA
jgi:hypothetical protein